MSAPPQDRVGVHVVSASVPGTDPPSGADPDPGPWLTWRSAIGWGLALVVVLVGSGWLLSWSSPVPVRDVVVHGAAEKSQDKLIKRAGIELGTPIREIDVDRVRRRIERIPGIQSVDVDLDRPWSVALVVRERFSVAQVGAGQGRFAVIDERGEQIRTTGQAVKWLPEVRGAPESIPGILTLLGEVPEDFRRRIDVAFQLYGRYGLVLRSGAVVQLGDGDDIPAKIEVLRTLLHLDAKSYNVTVPERPAVVKDPVQ